MQIGVMFGNPETTPGGKALKFYTSVRIDIRRIAQIKKGDEVMGGRHRVKIVKNKIAAPFRQTEFDMLYGEGISKEGEALALGEKLGLSHQALYNVASVSSAQSWSLTAYCPVPGPVPTSPANAHYKPGFMTALMLKDLRLSQTAAGAAGVATPLGAAATQLYALYDSLGNSETDFSGIVNMLRGDVRSTER